MQRESIIRLDRCQIFESQVLQAIIDYIGKEVKLMDHDTLNKLLGDMNKQDLIKLIDAMIQSDGKAEVILLEYCQQKSPPESVSLADENLLNRYWQNAWQIIDDANTYGGCSDEDENEASDELYKMEKLVAVKPTSWDCRRDLLDEIMEQVRYDNSGFTDQLVDLAEHLCKTADERRYLADCLAVDGNTYYKAKAAGIYREVGADDKFLETKMANLAYESDYLDLADYYVEHGDSTKAFKIVWTGFERCDSYLDGIRISVC